MTPPQAPATIVATASTAMMRPVSYSSPAAAALSVQSIPPTTVPSANGITIGRYFNESGQASSHSNRSDASHSTGQSAARGSTTACPSPAGIHPDDVPSRWIRPPTSSAASAPGIPSGSGIRAVRVASTMPSAVRPTSGDPRISRTGRNVISARAIAARLPSSPARGTIRWMGPATKLQSILNMPLATIAHMPTCQACRAAASRSSPAASDTA